MRGNLDVGHNDCFGRRAFGADVVMAFSRLFASLPQREKEKEWIGGIRSAYRLNQDMEIFDV
jgi:hypothetical protein